MNINKYYKKIDVRDKNNKVAKHTLFDYDKIWKDPSPIFLVISERGSKGKSTQAKRLARRIYEDENLKTMWMMNTSKQIGKEKRAHLTKPHQFLRDVFTGSERVKGNVVLTGDNEDNKDEWYQSFISLSTAENEKSSREDIGLLIYDEFNVGTRMIKNSQTDLISSLVATLTDPVNVFNSPFKKFIIHGNFKSLNSEWLLSMGVTKIDGDVTVIKDSAGKPLITILSPQYSKKEMKALDNSLKGVWTYEMQKQIGKADHVYFNSNLHDNIMNIDPKIEHRENAKLKYLIKVNGHQMILKKYESGDWGVYRVLDLKMIRPGAQNIIIDRKEVEENSVYSGELKNSLKSLIFAGKLVFDTSFTRENILKKLRT